MTGKKGPARVKARLPKGMRDVEMAELRALKHMLGVIGEVYERYGFEPLDTPAFEYTETLGKFLPDTDRPNEGVFSLQDEDEQWLSMRYDLTAPLARYVAANFDAIPKPFRRYQSGYVYRNEKPGPGRFRQFMQFDADTVGTANPAADAEMCMLACDTLEALGIPRGSYVVKINNRKILDGILETAGLSGEEHKTKRLTALRAIDKLDKVGIGGVWQLLGEGREDESGDFTKGANLSEEQIGIISSYLGTSYRESRLDLTKQGIESPLPNFAGEQTFAAPQTSLSSWKAAVKNSEIGFAGVGEIEEILKVCNFAGYDIDQIMPDASVVRGLEYYTGIVFEANLTLGVNKEAEQGVRFGSVGGGGRYDGLVSRFISQPVPAVGFSLGVSRLYAALDHLGELNAAESDGPVIVLVLDKDKTELYQKMTQELRNPKDGGLPIRAEMYVGDAGMKAQMKYADKRRAPCVVIQGEDERAKLEVTIKDLREGARLSGEISDRSEWVDARPAQVSVPRNELVAEVRKLLARQSER